MIKPFVGWFEITGIPDFGLTFAFFADPEGHVVGLSRGAVQ
jgi:hypothetical protein